MSSDLVVPSREEPVVRGAATLIGGPLGRHGRPRGAQYVLVVVLLMTAVSFALGFAQKAPCRNPGNWADQYQYTRLCYTDVLALYGTEGLSDGKRPYRDHPVEYPVLIGGTMGLAAKAADDVADPGDRATRFYDVTAVMLLGSALIVTATTLYLAGRRRPWDAAMVALAPGLVIHGLTNWDLIAAAVSGLALLAWARKRPWLAGVLIGLGTATKLYPVLFLAPLLVLCFRAGKLRQWLQTTVTAAGTFFFVYGVAALGAERFREVNGTFVKDPTGELSIFRFFSLNRTRGADWDSLWFALGRASSGDGKVSRFLRAVTPDVGNVSRLNTMVAVTFFIALVLITVLILRAPRRPRLPQVLFLMLAAFLLCNKVNSPQYTIWLIPLAVLARPRWGAFLTWQIAECFVLFTRFYFFFGLDHAGKGVPQNWFITAILVRDVALAVVMGLVVREILRPEEDVVRSDGSDDPAGGVLDGAPDREDRLEQDDEEYRDVLLTAGG